MLFWNEGGWEKDTIDYCSVFFCANEIERRKNKQGHCLTHKMEMGQNWGLATHN